MHLGNKTSTPINPTNGAAVAAAHANKLGGTAYFSLLRVLADMLDHVAKGGEGYMVIGTTKDRSAVSVTVNLDGGRDTRYGDDLEQVAAATTDWL